LVNLGNLKNAWTGSIFNYTGGDQIRVAGQASIFQRWEAEVSLGDSSPQKVVVSPTSSVQIEAVEIPVHAGWNMISLPLVIF